MKLAIGALLLACGGVRPAYAEGGESGHKDVHVIDGPQDAPQLVVTQAVFQTMEGFGVSGAWVAGHIEQQLSPEAQREVLDMLFTEAGANLSILRVKVEPDVGSRGHDSGSEFLMAQAHQRGVSRFYATPWTPPAEWEDGNNNLKQEFYDEYAQFLADYLNLYRNKGLNISWLSAQNEPDLSCEYESCSWSLDELCCFVSVLRDVLNGNGLGDVRLAAPEAMGWPQTYSYVEQLLESGASEQINVWASHGYWGMERNEEMNVFRKKLNEMAQQQGASVWMTEWSDLDTRWQGDPNDPAVFGLDDGLLWAERIATDLVEANVSAWFYWWIYNPNPVNFPYSANEGLIVRTPDNRFLYPKRFYTFAQFSRFIRPGAQRIGVAGAPEDLKVVAFRDLNLNEIVVVAVNRAETARPVVLRFEGYTLLGSARPYRTSEAENVTPLAEAPVSGDSLAVELQGRSVTTFIVPAALNSGP
jgi:glucuronoarabinoxylan endo-1,4-beta-xylanase